MKTIGEMIRERRKKLGVSMNVLADRIGVSIGTMHNIETNKSTKSLSNRLIEIITGALYFDPEHLKSIRDEADAFARLSCGPEQQTPYPGLALKHIRQATLKGQPQLGFEMACDWAATLRNEIARQSTKRSWPLYELLSWMLFEQGETFGLHEKRGLAFGEYLKLAHALDHIALKTRQELPGVLACATRAVAHYIMDDYSNAFRYQTEVLDRSRILSSLGDYMSSRWWLVFLRTQGVSAAQMGDQATANQIIRAIREFLDACSLPLDEYHLGLSTIARIQAMLASEDVWGVIGEIAAVSKQIDSDDFPIVRLVEIGNVLEAMYYLREPDRGYVETLEKTAAAISKPYGRHADKIGKMAEQVLALRSAPRLPKLWSGFLRL